MLIPFAFWVQSSVLLNLTLLRSKFTEYHNFLASTREILETKVLIQYLIQYMC